MENALEALLCIIPNNEDLTIIKKLTAELPLSCSEPLRPGTSESTPLLHHEYLITNSEAAKVSNLIPIISSTVYVALQCHSGFIIRVNDGINDKRHGINGTEEPQAAFLSVCKPWFFSMGKSGTLRVWDISEGNIVSQIPLCTAETVKVIYSNDNFQRLLDTSMEILEDSIADHNKDVLYEASGPCGCFIEWRPEHKENINIYDDSITDAKHIKQLQSINLIKSTYSIAYLQFESGNITVFQEVQNNLKQVVRLNSNPFVTGIGWDTKYGRLLVIIPYSGAWQLINLSDDVISVSQTNIILPYSLGKLSCATSTEDTIYVGSNLGFVYSINKCNVYKNINKSSMFTKMNRPIKKLVYIQPDRLFIQTDEAIHLLDIPEKVVIYSVLAPASSLYWYIVTVPIRDYDNFELTCNWQKAEKSAIA